MLSARKVKRTPRSVITGPRDAAAALKFHVKTQAKRDTPIYKHYEHPVIGKLSGFDIKFKMTSVFRSVSNNCAKKLN